MTEISEHGIRVGNEFIESSTILWAAGVAANPLNKTLGAELDRQGRVIVSSDLSVPESKNIFVIGDQAQYKSGLNQEPLPGLAPVAIQQGRFVAKVIKKAIQGKPTSKEIFRYVDKGQMATIGRSRAVGLFKNFQFHGFIAWMAWLVVHIYYLIGFKNRFFVLFQWSWTYLTYRRGNRLLLTGALGDILAGSLLTDNQSSEE